MSLTSLDWLTPEFAYIFLSAVIAMLIWTESMMLKKTAGKLPKSTFFHISSILDTVWFFVSLWVLYAFNLQSLALAVPVAYSIYTIFGWIYGTKLIRKKGVPDSPEDLVIPMRYVAYSQSFSLIFLLLCLLVLATPWLPISGL
ncbi:hypothetical protein [Psychrobacter sp. I-STPA6b]|uniref:hypothetical protein n=1 Tax=Psychrobacter sp. I-STPA6b TaxID=2585718 RepID=UPI001D0C0E0E|nr:hypothetical protein [Psychrobacter sp. I-STPA6b]